MVVDIERILARDYYSLKQTMKVIDNSGLGMAFVVDDAGKLVGVVTDGDIRRAILRGSNLDQQVKTVMNIDPIVASDAWTKEELSEFLLRTHRVQQMIPEGGSLKVPVVNSKGEIKKILFVSPNHIVDPSENPREVKQSIHKVLVIGGAGYFGTVLIHKLLQRGYEVIAVDNLSYGRDGISHLQSEKNFTFIEGDIRDISVLVSSIKNVDAVVLLAGIVGDKASAEDPTRTLEINYLATKMVIDCCKYFQVNRVIFASTCSVYGASKTEEILTEKSSLNPVSLYAETKIKGEQSILDSVDENFSPVILRMGTLYGYSPNMRFDLVVNLLTAQAIFDKKISIFGGNQWRPFLHLYDAADAYLQCLEAPLEKIKGEIFNVVSENLKIVDIGNILCSIFPSLEMKVADKLIDLRNYRVSSSKIKYAIGFEPQFKIKDGIAEIGTKINEGVVSHYKDSKYRTDTPKIITK